MTERPPPRSSRPARMPGSCTSARCRRTGRSTASSATARVVEEFRARVLARLVLLPRDDPQFRRNRERIIRDAERENILLEWDLGLPERRRRLIGSAAAA